MQINYNTGHYAKNSTISKVRQETITTHCTRYTMQIIQPVRIQQLYCEVIHLRSASFYFPSASENISIPGLISWHYHRSLLNHFPTFSGCWSDFITGSLLKNPRLKPLKSESAKLCQRRTLTTQDAELIDYRSCVILLLCMKIMFPTVQWKNKYRSRWP